MEPQLPFWGTIHAENEEGFNKEEQEYLISEGYRILESFGNHPSFVMFSLGNELWGSPERMNLILKNYKEFDSSRLYTIGSNNFQFYPTIVENDDFFCGVRLSRERLIRGSYAMCDARLDIYRRTFPMLLIAMTTLYVRQLPTPLKLRKQKLKFNTEQELKS